MDEIVSNNFSDEGDDLTNLPNSTSTGLYNSQASESISGQNLVQFINSDTDCDTSLFTGEINCLEIPLTNDNNKSE